MENFKLTRLSATQLSQLAADDFCPRCFWLKARLGFRTPWNIFPGIFRDIDEYIKRFTESYFKEVKRLPPWLERFGAVSLVKVPKFGQFGAAHPAGLLLTGEPDQVFRKADNRLAIVENKTARIASDRMLPVYKIQISIYEWIAPHYGLGEVAETALIYYDPMTDLQDWQSMCFGEPTSTEVLQNYPEDLKIQAQGLELKLRPYIIDVESQDIDQLVAEAKVIAESEFMPNPSNHNGVVCTECERVLTMSLYRSKQDLECLQEGFKDLENLGCGCDLNSGWVCKIHEKLRIMRARLNIPEPATAVTESV